MLADLSMRDTAILKQLDQERPRDVQHLCRLHRRELGVLGDDGDPACWGADIIGDRGTSSPSDLGKNCRFLAFSVASAPSSVIFHRDLRW